MCPLGGLHIQVPLCINYYSVPWVVFIYRFHCTSTTTVCPLGGLYIQVPLYINYYSVYLGGLYIQVPLYINYYCNSMSLGWSSYIGSTIHQLLQCVPWVVFMYRFHCTSTTTVCSLGGLYIQVPLYINYYSVSLGWSLYTGSTVHQLLQCVPWVVFIYRFHCTSTTTVCTWVVFIYRFHCTSTTTVCTWVAFLYKFHCTSTTTVCPLGGSTINTSTLHNSIFLHTYHGNIL